MIKYEFKVENWIYEYFGKTKIIFLNFIIFLFQDIEINLNIVFNK